MQTPGCLKAARPTQAARAISRSNAAAQPRAQQAPPARPAPRDRAPQHAPTGGERLAAGLVGAAAALALVLTPAADASTMPFLRSAGARGPLVDEEAQLLRLRQEKEGEVREELAAARRELEQEALSAQASAMQLCATPFGIDVVGITELVALTGALVGGVSARRRKQELERLNEQLRTINTQLRQQARSGTIFAPGLTYAPTAADLAAPPLAVALPALTLPPRAAEPAAAPSEDDDAAAAADAAADAAPSSPAVSILSSYDEDEERPEVKQCQAALKEGKRLLKERQAGPAMVRFEKAHMLAKAMGDRVRERRAVRGLAAAARMTGQGRAAIRHLERVLEISRELDDFVGDADAYGTIADIYTDLDEFEKAGEFYDKYIERMSSDGPV
jgi:tetratricopeptide (TPR) repeat protein